MEMASVIAAPPPSPAAMASRPVALRAADPNYSMSTATIKRPRSQSITQRDHGQALQPPIKKQIVEIPQAQQILKTPVRNKNDPKVMPPRRSTNRTRTIGGSPPPFNPIPGRVQQTHRKATDGAAATGAQTKATATVTTEGIEKIRAWQGHYRRVFPTFVFYFESVPPDTAVKFQRQVQTLGASVEKFFSNAVTHVITTRPIPPETASKSASQQQQQRSVPAKSQASQKGIHPSSILDKTATFNGQTHARAEFTFKAPQGVKKYTSLSRADVHGRISYDEVREIESRKPQQNVSQILLKARELGIKIWALEKLQRMLNAMVDFDGANLYQLIQPKQDNTEVAQKGTHTAADVELSRLLRNERLHGPSDRDPDALSKDMVYFQGPFIMVRDMKSKHRPIMVREYEKVAKREEGSWPQFRSTSSGKCPFIDEVATKEKEKEQKETREYKEIIRRKKVKEGQEEDKATLHTMNKMQPPAPPAKARAAKTLTELNPQDARQNYGRPAASNSRIQHAAPAARLFTVPSVVPAKRISNEMAFTSASKVTGGHPSETPRYAYEPAASGVQPSNVTSAIRSQAVSSHMDIPGAKTAMSKDMLELKRKAAGSMIDPHKRYPIPQASRFTEQKLAVSKMEHKTTVKKDAMDRTFKIFEDIDSLTAQKNAGAAAAMKQTVKKEPKPGYCENCREKFEDFDAHTVSRRHRKFAMNQNNFAELDELLKELARPLKQRSN